MEKIPTVLAEKIYDVLTRYADAKPTYEEKESFVYHFGVLKNKSNHYNLTCIDDSPRSFHKTKDGLFLKGKGAGRVNVIIKKLASEFGIGESTNAVSSTN